jgi:hypothetical protein
MVKSRIPGHFVWFSNGFAQWVYLYTAYGKIGTSSVKMLNFSAFPSFLTNLTVREK